MSQTKAGPRSGRAAGRAVPAQPGAPAGGPQGATLAVPDVASSVGRLGKLLSGSPGRLRIAAAVAAVGCLVLALAGAATMQLRANALEDARSHAAQVVRVQKAGADLVRADAAVSNGFLAGGAEPAALTAQYDTAIAEASRLLVDAAAAQPDDAPKLAQANQLLADYARQIAHARDNNRLNLPLGSGYLVLGSQTVLRDQLLPLLDDVVAGDATNVDDAYASAENAVVLFWVAALAAVAVLAGVQVWLARRTHRILNVGLTAGSVLVVVGVVVGIVVVASTAGTANDVRTTSYAATSALAKARSAAYSAKGLESLTLVKQGGGAAYEKAWGEAATTISQQLDIAAKAGVNVQDALGAMATWKVTHAKIRELDDGGKWPDAVAQARSATTANQFAALVDAIDAPLATQSKTVSDRLGTTWTPLQGLGWGLLGLGVLAGIASVGGISRRLGEYR